MSTSSTNKTKLNANSASVYINGHSVMSIPCLFAMDPASHKKTVYLQIDSLNNLLKTLNVSQSWDGHAWRWLTGDAKSLSVAYANTQNASHSQFTGTLDENIQITATDPKAATTSGVPANMDITMKMQGSTSINSGVRSAYITVTTSTPNNLTSAASTAVPVTIQEYMERNRIWMNLGDKWQELTGSEQLIQSLQTQNPMNSMDFNMLQQIHASVNGDTATYTATINTSSMSETISALFSSLSQSTAIDAPTTTGNQQSSISVSQFKPFLDAILQQMKGTMTITTGQVDGEPRITKDKATIDMNLPFNTLASIAATSGTTGEKTGIALIYRQQMAQHPVAFRECHCTRH